MTKKRGNNEGSITYRKDGRYMAPYIVHTAQGPKRRILYSRSNNG